MNIISYKDFCNSSGLTVSSSDLTQKLYSEKNLVSVRALARFLLTFKVLRTSGFIKEIRTNSVSIRILTSQLNYNIILLTLSIVMPSMIKFRLLA